MIKNKGIAGILFILILFVSIAISIIVTVEGLKMFSELMGYDSQFKVTGEKYDRNDKYRNSYDVELDNNKLTPVLITQSRIYLQTIKCAYCGFIIDKVNTLIKDESNNISHGICAKCYKVVVEEMGYKINKKLYDKAKKRMDRAVRMGWNA